MNFKKYSAAFLVSIILLTGCTQGSSALKKKDGKEIVASIKDKDIYADDLYNKIVATNAGKNFFFNAVLNSLVNKHFPVTDAMKTDAKMIVQATQNQYRSQYQENADTQLKSDLANSGLKDIDAYEESIIKSLQSAKFMEKYVNAHYDEIFNDYYKQAKPRTASIIKINMTDEEKPSDKEQAKLNEVVALTKTSKSFNEIARDYSDDEKASENEGSLGLVDASNQTLSGYGEEVSNAMLSLAEGQISEPIKAKGAYYILKCESTNPETIKSKIKDLGVSFDSPLLQYDKYLIYIVYNSYPVKYKDNTIKDIVSGVVEKALKEREEARNGGNQA